MIEFHLSAKPTSLFVGRCLDEAGQFKWELNPPKMYLSDVEGISCYVGRHSRVLHIDDVYLRLDLQRLNDFGINIVYNCLKSVKCERHSLYQLASRVCMENYQKKTPDVFEKNEAVFSFNGGKRRVQLLLAFIKQQSGESVTETLCFTSDLQPQTLPEKDTD